MKAKSKALIASLALVGVVAAAAIFRVPFLAAMGGYLVTEDRLVRSDAVVVLLGSFPDRILEAVDLYKEGYAPLIVVTRGQVPAGTEELSRRGISIPEAHDWNLMVLRQLHIPSDAIAVLTPRANSTISELRSVVDFVRERKLKSIILVTSRYHSTRAVGLFNEIARGELAAVSRPSRYDTFRSDAWWQNRTDATWVFLEYVKLAYHQIEPFWRPGNSVSPASHP